MQRKRIIRHNKSHPFSSPPTIFKYHLNAIRWGRCIDERRQWDGGVVNDNTNGSKFFDGTDLGLPILSGNWKINKNAKIYYASISSHCAFELTLTKCRSVTQQYSCISISCILFLNSHHVIQIQFLKCSPAICSVPMEYLHMHTPQIPFNIRLFIVFVRQSSNSQSDSRGTKQRNQASNGIPLLYSYSVEIDISLRASIPSTSAHTERLQKKKTVWKMWKLSAKLVNSLCTQTCISSSM